MRLIVNYSLAAGFSPIYTCKWHQRASLPFKPGVPEREVYNNEYTALFSVLMFEKPFCDNVLQPEPLQHINTLRLGKR